MFMNKDYMSGAVDTPTGHSIQQAGRQQQPHEEECGHSISLWCIRKAKEDFQQTTSQYISNLAIP